jgi:hypothetical protein
VRDFSLTKGSFFPFFPNWPQHKNTTGRNCRDAFLGLLKTCAKLKIPFWDYLGDRLAVPGAKAIPYLPHVVRAAALAT